MSSQTSHTTLEDFIDRLDDTSSDHLKHLRTEVLLNAHAVKLNDSEISGSFNGGRRYTQGGHCLYMSIDSIGNEVYLISTPLGPITISIDFNRRDPKKQNVQVRAYDRAIGEHIMTVRDSEEMNRSGIRTISQLKEVLELTLGEK